MHQQVNNPSSTTNNKGEIKIQKGNDNSPDNKLKVMEDFSINGREFKIAIMKKKQMNTRKLRKAVLGTQK